MAERINLRLNDELEGQIGKIATNAFQGNKTETVNTILAQAINSDFEILVGGVPTSVQKILSDKVLDWNIIANLSHSFKTNITNLSYEYQSALYQLLIVLMNRKDTFVSTAQNLNYYYRDYSVDPIKNGFINFYLNVRGTIGNELISDFLSRQRKKYRKNLADPKSRIWICKYPQFKQYSRDNPRGERFFEALLDKLGLKTNFFAVQLHYTELRFLANYIDMFLPDDM